MFPAQALAEALLARGWRVELSTDPRGARYAGGFPADVTRHVVDSATLARGGIAGRFAAPLRILAGVVAARARMRRARPAVVVGFGGYPTIPALAAAWSLGIPRMIHEQNGVLGRVNRAFARRVDLVACGMEGTVLPAGARAVHVGNPVRAAIRAACGAAYAAPGAGPLRILVIGGSQGARILSDIVPAALAALSAEMRARLSVSHQARPEDAGRVAAAYGAAGIAATVQPFFDDVPARLAAAQLVVSRAGASSVAEIGAVGRPAILIPYAAAAADHQTANARALAAAGAAVVIAERDLTVAGLSAAVAAILADPGRAAAMAAAARAAGRTDATERLVALVERVAEGKKGSDA
jgi:UDP-N-acetylglucosamine--N-acetylmuramyl-(pentapeptide) pyrophosphoryl-undecaprenol N-acetylglucosamine transferase